MSTERGIVVAAEKKNESKTVQNVRRVTVGALLWAALLFFAAGFASAQVGNFYQIGQIRAVVSETAAKNASGTDTIQNAGFRFSGAARSKTEFYFAYSVVENGAPTEKWVSLPDNGKWSRLSNQTVRISGKLDNNKLQDAQVSAISALTENYLTAPPPTVGPYKVVAVPLTIQSSSSTTERSAKDAASEVTAEAIRNNFYNAPNSVNKYYLEASYGKFSFTGVHHPQIDVVPVTIRAPIESNCQEQIISQFTPIVRQRLIEQNIDTTNGGVDLGIIIFNDTPGCPPYPFATRGALGQRGAPLWLWMPESWFVTGPLIMTHEIGHVLGGNHPAALRCTDFDNPQTCVAVEAEDRDLMTSGGKFYLMPNNYERRRWGWHPPGAFDDPAGGSVYMLDLHSPLLPFIKDGERQGRFYFRNLSGVHLGWDVYPEARRNWGQFEKYGSSDEAFRLGLAVRIGHSNYGDPDALSVLIDPNDTAQVADAPLRENQQVRIGGITIKCTREHNPRLGTRMKILE